MAKKAKSTDDLLREELEKTSALLGKPTPKLKKEKTMKTAKAHKTKTEKTEKIKKVKKEKKVKKIKTEKKTKKVKKEKKERRHRVSKSGKFKSTRHMMEVLFAKNKNLTKEEANKAVSKEFPNGAWAKRMKVGKKSHFPAYKTRIVSHCVFKTINPPSWAKKHGAKIK